jgi:hypothetical protein
MIKEISILSKIPYSISTMFVGIEGGKELQEAKNYIEPTKVMYTVNKTSK